MKTSNHFLIILTLLSFLTKSIYGQAEKQNYSHKAHITLLADGRISNYINTINLTVGIQFGRNFIYAGYADITYENSIFEEDKYISGNKLSNGIRIGYLIETGHYESTPVHFFLLTDFIIYNEQYRQSSLVIYQESEEKNELHIDHGIGMGMNVRIKKKLKAFVGASIASNGFALILESSYANGFIGLSYSF